MICRTIISCLKLSQIPKFFCTEVMNSINDPQLTHLEKHVRDIFAFDDIIFHYESKSSLSISHMHIDPPYLNEPPLFHICENILDPKDFSMNFIRKEGEENKFDCEAVDISVPKLLK